MSSIAFTRLQSTPVLAKGSTYGGIQADALAAPGVCWDGTRWVMTVSIWNVANAKWYSVFFTASDLAGPWSYVSGSLRSPGGTDYILGNGGIAWFGGKYWFAYNHYASGAGSPGGVAVDWSTDLTTWTSASVQAAGETYGADPQLNVSADGSKLELWYLNSSRQSCMADSPDGTTWTARGVFHVNTAAYLNYGEPSVHYRNSVRFLTYDRAAVSGQRSIGIVASTRMVVLQDAAQADLEWTDYGVALAPSGRTPGRTRTSSMGPRS
jgi:hypothetical protein